MTGDRLAADSVWWADSLWWDGRLHTGVALRITDGQVVPVAADEFAAGGQIPAVEGHTAVGRTADALGQNPASAGQDPS